MKRTIKTLALLLAVSALQSCGKENPFLITETSVGPLLQGSKVSELETLFPQDSIVRDSSTLGPGALGAKIEIYEKGGRHLLSLTPNTDSVPGIGNIQIMDPRYRTKAGIGLKSTYGEIENQYNFKKVHTTFRNVVIIPRGSNLYFTIDKEELPGNLRFGNAQIEAVQIPSEAKVKHLMLAWKAGNGDQAKP